MFSSRPWSADVVPCRCKRRDKCMSAAQPPLGVDNRREAPPLTWAGNHFETSPHLRTSCNPVVSLHPGLIAGGGYPRRFGIAMSLLTPRPSVNVLDLIVGSANTSMRRVLSPQVELPRKICGSFHGLTEPRCRSALLAMPTLIRRSRHKSYAINRMIRPLPVVDAVYKKGKTRDTPEWVRMASAGLAFISAAFWPVSMLDIRLNSSPAVTLG